MNAYFNRAELKNRLRNFLYTVSNLKPAVKLGVSALLAVILIFLLLPVSHKPDAEIRKILAYSPATEAAAYYERQGPKAAYDFITFYESLPGVTADAQLNAIKQKAEEERSSWLYMGKEFGAGLIGLEHNETYAKWANTVVTFVPYGTDVQQATKYANELLQEWNNYKNGAEVDMLHLGVATLGLVEVCLSLLPGDNPTINKLKGQTNALLNSLRPMNAKLRKIVTDMLEPALKKLESSGLADETDARSLFKTITNKKNQFLSILDDAEGTLDHFQSLVNLENRNKNLVPAVVAASSNFKELDKNAAVAQEIAKLNPNVLLYGGAAAIAAAERLKAKGQLNIKTLEAAMKYGVPGLNAAGVISMDKLEKEIAQAKTGSCLRPRFPLIVTLILILLLGLAAAVLWRPNLFNF